jgi:hypothetical protein
MSLKISTEIVGSNKAGKWQAQVLQAGKGKDIHCMK